MLTTNFRRLHVVVLTCLALTATAAVASAQKNDQNNKDNAKQADAKRPRVSLRAQPPVGVAPFRVVLYRRAAGWLGRLRRVLLPDGRMGMGRPDDVRIDP